MALTLTVIHRGETENKVKLIPKMVVEYLGHLPYGNVKIRFPDGKTDVAHQNCFKELAA